MTTLAVPYYGRLYRDNTGYERVFFIVNYDTSADRACDVRLGVWDERRTPDLAAWLRENGILNVVCRDAVSLPLLQRVVKTGITVLGNGSQMAQKVMGKLLV